MFVRFVQSAIQALVAPLRWACRPIIRQINEMTGVPNDYLGFIADRSLGAFFDFLLFAKMSGRRQRLPSDAAHVARILATRHVDCGTCVQAMVNMALGQGLRAEWIQAVLDDQPHLLPADLKDVYDFVAHILEHTYEEGPLRELLRERYGDQALIDLAYSVASAQVFPYTKKVLGFATSCALVRVDLPAA